jgi:hypothetical protein
MLFGSKQGKFPVLFALFLSLALSPESAFAFEVPSGMIKILLRTEVGTRFFSRLAGLGPESSLKASYCRFLLAQPEQDMARQLIETRMTDALVSLIHEGRIARPRSIPHEPDLGLLARFFRELDGEAKVMMMAQRLNQTDSGLAEVLEFIPLRTRRDFLRPRQRFFPTDPSEIPN